MVDEFLVIFKRGNLGMHKEKKLLEEIEKQRLEMINLTLQTSLSSQEVIQISQNLDCLLNKYDKSVKEKTNGQR
ncbi:aspartyl-phosphate phosphatase Spo0E family protein [Gottfriedia solisilvae]|uniref:aspartyl-phosphate phosphatase Spo0E family protein n=1 Tax=Gottfriedia solisilvae TaxID=1516104 RepID=UPI003D2EB734